MTIKSDLAERMQALQATELSEMVTQIEGEQSREHDSLNRRQARLKAIMDSIGYNEIAAGIDIFKQVPGARFIMAATHYMDEIEVDFCPDENTFNPNYYPHIHIMTSGAFAGYDSKHPHHYSAPILQRPMERFFWNQRPHKTKEFELVNEPSQINIAHEMLVWLAIALEKTGLLPDKGARAASDYIFENSPLLRSNDKINCLLNSNDRTVIHEPFSRSNQRIMILGL